MGKEMKREVVLLLKTIAGKPENSSRTHYGLKRYIISAIIPQGPVIRALLCNFVQFLKSRGSE